MNVSPPTHAFSPSLSSEREKMLLSSFLNTCILLGSTCTPRMVFNILSINGIVTMIEQNPLNSDVYNAASHPLHVPLCLNNIFSVPCADKASLTPTP